MLPHQEHLDVPSPTSSAPTCAFDVALSTEPSARSALLTPDDPLVAPSKHDVDSDMMRDLEATAHCASSLGPDAWESLGRRFVEDWIAPGHESGGSDAFQTVRASDRRVEALASRLRDPSPLIRGFVVFVMGLQSQGPHADDIADLLSDADASVSQRAVEALQRLGSTGVAALQWRFCDARNEVQAEVAVALQGSGERGARALGAWLRDRDARVRRRAAFALEGMGDPGLEVLVDHLTASDAWTRRAAAEAIARIGQPAEHLSDVLAESLHDEDTFVRVGILRAFLRFDSSLVFFHQQALASRLEDTHYLVRRLAAEVLGCLGAGAAFHVTVR